MSRATLFTARARAVLPVNTAAPVISVSGSWATLSCTTGTWTGPPTSYTYQWKRAGSSISGATSSTYSTTGNDGSGHTDYGPSITCEVTASNGVGSGTPAASNALAYLPTAEGATCKRFLDPSLLSSGAVSTWADQTGAPSLAQATGALQPVQSATSLNGTPGVTFDGVNDYLQSANFDLSALSGMRILFAAIDTATAASIAITHENPGLSTGVGFEVDPNISAGKINVYCAGTTTNAAGAAQITETLAAAKVVHIGLDTALPTGVTYIRTDGSAQTLTTVASACVAGNLGNKPDTVGAYFSGTLPWAGTMGVIVYLSGLASDAVSSRVEQFMAWRTGKSPL